MFASSPGFALSWAKVRLRPHHGAQSPRYSQTTRGYETCFGGVARPQLQPPLQHEDKPTGHKTQAAALPPPQTKANSLHSMGKKLPKTTKPQNQKRRIQLIRQEQTSSWPQCQVLRGSCCEYLCSARWARACPGGTGEPANLRLTSWFQVKEHSKASKSHISAHL